VWLNASLADKEQPEVFSHDKDLFGFSGKEKTECLLPLKPNVSCEKYLSEIVKMGRNENGIRVIQARMPYPQINSKPNCKQFYAYP